MNQGVQYGGQAVIEGVMIRGVKGMAIAVRRPDAQIVVERRALVPWGKRYKGLGLPLVRGVVAFVESLFLGMQALTFSASLFAEGEGEELSTRDLLLMLGLAFLLTVGFFIVFPAYLINLVKSHVASNIVLNICEGLIKLSFFLIYILAISGMRDIRRVFEYHGAEHKTIHAYEAGEELEVANVRKYSTLHPRCGTSFLLLVFFVSVLIFSFFGRPPFWQRVGLHLAILPLVAALSYELIRFAGRKGRGFLDWLVRILTAPGMLLQKLTTREPDDGQLEVAISALRGTLEQETTPI